MIKVTIDTSKATAKELQELKEKFGKMEGLKLEKLHNSHFVKVRILFNLYP